MNKIKLLLLAIAIFALTATSTLAADVVENTGDDIDKGTKGAQ